MNFAEKLYALRKQNGFTQETLAEKLCVTRQAIVKWESASAYPDIGNLVQLSNLLHVKVDYLVKGQVCSVSLAKEALDDWEEIMRFRLKAAASTYAAQLNAVDSTRLDSKDFRFEEG